MASFWARVWDYVSDLFADDAQPSGDRHLRGPKLVTLADARREAQKQTKPGQATFRWGYCDLPYKVGRQGIRVTGSQGSGKTALIRMLLKNGILDRIGSEDSLATNGVVRAYIFDAKNDYIRDLAPLGLPEGVDLVFHVHPFAETGRAWDIAKDMTDDAAVEAFSELLFPKYKNQTGNQVFFETAQRMILRATLTSVRKLRGDDWSLRDIILALLDHDDLIHILKASDHVINKAVLADYFPKDNPELRTNIRAGLLGAANEFITVAARWHWAARNPARTFSLKQWLDKPSVLVVGFSHKYAPALMGLNRALFGRMKDLLLSEGQDPNRTTWILLDELAAPGELKGIKELFAEGRDKGVSVLLGFQDISLLDEHYTEGGRDALISLCRTHCALHIGSAKTRKWAQEEFGYEELMEMQQSTSEGPSGTSTSTSFHRVQKPVVHEGELLKLPLPTLETDKGVSGFFVTLSNDVYRLETTWSEMTDGMPNLVEGRLEPETDDRVNLDTLPAWSESERESLRLPKRGPQQPKEFKQRPRIDETGKTPEDDENVF